MVYTLVNIVENSEFIIKATIKSIILLLSSVNLSHFPNKLFSKALRIINL
jgi:hypothetical protein